MPDCYVIMPYGGDDKERKKYFTGVFKNILAPAARQAGYEPHRSDIKAAPGNITKEIIHALAESDMVIADLTDTNANVFFELGVRHALKKSGTVHVIESSHQLPFDVGQYRVIEYTTEISSLQDTIDDIAEAIQMRAKAPGRSDNPVHDALPELPRDLQDVGDVALRKQLKDLERQIEDLSEDNQHLEQRLKEAAPEDTFSDDFSERTDDDILKMAEEVMRSTGSFVVLRLTEAAQKGPEEFASELQKIVTSPYLAPDDFTEIARLCAMTGLDSYRLASLEIAYKRFKEVDEIVLALADAYDDSQNPAMWDRGRRMVENYLGISHKEDGKPEFAAKPKGDYDAAVGILFNLYFRTRHQDWVLAIADQWEELIGPDAKILRNAGRAHQQMGDLQEAEDRFKRAIEIDPSDDTSHALYADLLDDLGRNEESYDEHIEALLCDPDDGTRFANLAIHILNRGFYKNRAGEMLGPIPRRSRFGLAMPLFLRSLGDRMRQGILRNRIVNILLRADAVAEAKAIADGEMPDGDYDTTVLDVVKDLLSKRSGNEDEIGKSEAIYSPKKSLELDEQ